MGCAIAMAPSDSFDSSDLIDTATRLAGEIIARIRALSSFNTVSVRAVRREFSKRLAKAPAHTVLQVAQLLLDDRSSDFRFVAYELIRHHRAALASLREKDLERFGRGLDSWGTVDMFACYLAGPAWRENQNLERCDSSMGPFKGPLVATRCAGQHGAAQQSGPGWKR